LSYKVRPYVQPVNANIRTGLEGFMLELLVCVICGVFAYIGYEIKVALLMVPCGVVSLLCLIGPLSNLYFLITDTLKMNQ